MGPIWKKLAAMPFKNSFNLLIYWFLSLIYILFMTDKVLINCIVWHTLSEYYSALNDFKGQIFFDILIPFFYTIKFVKFLTLVVLQIIKLLKN